MKKSLRLTVKMGILVGVSIVVSAIAVEIVALRLFRNEFKESIIQNLEVTDQGITDTLRDWRRILEYAVVALAGRPNFVEALVADDAEETEILAKEKQDIVGMDIMIVTDEDGIIMAGGTR